MNTFSYGSLTALILLFINDSLIICPVCESHHWDSYTVTWELSPLGYLVPTVMSADGVPAVGDDIALSVLLDKVVDDASFPAAYVWLRQRAGLTVQIPARLHMQHVDAEYGSLKVRVAYDRGGTGLTKVISYPNRAAQKEAISGEILFLERAGSEDSAGRRDSVHPYGYPTAPPRGTEIRISVVTSGFIPYIIASLPSAMVAAELPNANIDEATIMRLFDEDWIGCHLLLTQYYYPGSIRVKAYAEGVEINANGLLVCLERRDTEYVISYPGALIDRAMIIAFWSRHCAAESAVAAGECQ